VSELAIALEDLAAGNTLTAEQIDLVRVYLDYLAGL